MVPLRILSLLFFLSVSKAEYVKEILKSLGLKPSPEHLQRAKFAYENELRKNIVELNTKNNGLVDFIGHVKDSKQASRCKRKCRRKRQIKDVHELGFETLTLKSKSSQQTNLVLDDRKLDLENMLEEYKRLEIIDQNVSICQFFWAEV